MALNIEHHLKLLIEISSGRDLISDTLGSDPYVVVKLGDKEVHQTKHISKNLNPKWGPEEKSSFILTCEEFQLVDADGLTFVVKNYNLIGKNDDLGTVQVSPKDLLEEGQMGQMIERKLTASKRHEGKDAGYLTIRVRRATPEDEHSMASNAKKHIFEIKTGVFDFAI